MAMITNELNIPLDLAVWVLDDQYDYDARPNSISATTLMQPPRITTLRRRQKPSDRKIDVKDLVAAAMGQSLHTAVEQAWLHPARRTKALELLGIPRDVADAIVVNPSDAELIRMDKEGVDYIPIILERRIERAHQGMFITGKFDKLIEGQIRDTKSTSVWSFIKDTKDGDYQRQMSIYKWIDSTQAYPKIQNDVGLINFIFTDWTKGSVGKIEGYPTSRIAQKSIPLLSLQETERWVTDKLYSLARAEKLPEDMLPRCTDEELWRSEPAYKYYSDPAKAQLGGRSSKNFTSFLEANNHLREKGKGAVVTVPGEPKRCSYCPVFDLCSQKDEYFGPE